MSSVSMKTVLLIGTLDTKGKEYGYVRAKLEEEGLHTILIDVSCKYFRPEFPSDISCNEVAQAANVDFSSVGQWERVPAQKVMTEGAIRLSEELFQKGKLDGIMALGGSNGTAIACAVMQRFPVGIPKLMVSTMASGDVRGYVGWKDIVMFHPVGDISLNGMTRRIFSGAARALAGMLREDQATGEARKTQIALTVFGVVQACAEHAKFLLEERGYEVMVFHTSGTGGMALEELVKQGMIDAVLDISTTEVTDEVIGGVLTAGPHRMEAAGAMGIPQVIVPGAIDLINFRTPETVPEKWRDRVFYRHTPHITLMRTDVGESALLGRVFAKKINQARGSSLVLIPLEGFSAYDSPRGPKAINLEGGPASHPWFWPEADRAFYEALKENLDLSKVSYQELPVSINDPRFAEKAVEELDRMIRERTRCVESGERRTR
jgi:uncharacterized protein (UPF0261 family)